MKTAVVAYRNKVKFPIYHGVYDGWLKSPQQIADEQKAEQRRKARSEKAKAKRAKDLADAEEILRTTSDPVQAYYAWMTTCPFLAFDDGRKAWKAKNPLVVNGVTYHDEWDYQLSNSGKSGGSANGWLVGSDGSRHALKQSAPNRRNDPKRNFGLPPRG